MRQVATTLFLLLAGCVSLTVPRISEEEDLGLRAFLIDDLLRSFASTNEVCYVAFGKNWTEDLKMVFEDPPSEFLRHFEGRWFMVKPASVYPFCDDRFSVKANALTGRPDGVFVAEILEWLAPDKAMVRASCWRSPLWGHSYLAIAVRVGDIWQIREQLGWTEW